MSEVGVIYMLTNLENGKQYVGQTTGLNRRIAEHKLRDGQVVDKAIDKYGWDSFEVKVLEDNVLSSELDKKEVKYIEKYNTFHGLGYNCAEGGEGCGSEDNPMYDIDMTGENNPMYDVHRTGKDNPMYGKNHSKKSRQKMQKKCEDRSGANNPRSKISQEEGKGILETYKECDNLVMQDLADKHNVSGNTISEIVNKKHWTTREDDNNE